MYERHYIHCVTWLAEKGCEKMKIFITPKLGGQFLYDPQPQKIELISNQGTKS